MEEVEPSMSQGQTVTDKHEFKSGNKSKRAAVFGVSRLTCFTASINKEKVFQLILPLPMKNFCIDLHGQNQFVATKNHEVKHRHESKV